MSKTITCFLFTLLALPLVCRAGEAAGAPKAADKPTFQQATDSVSRDLKKSIAELNQLREQVAKETIPLSRKLRALEDELTDSRQEYQQRTRALDTQTLNLTNLRKETEARQAEVLYLSNLLGEYIRNFESSLHIAELQRYAKPLETAKLAVENGGLSDHEVFAAQAQILGLSIGRLEDALGGTRFEGTAVDSIGLVRKGTFVLVGPVAIFVSNDGKQTGTAEQRLGSLEPAIIPFADETDTAAAAALATTSEGFLPFDATLGNAHKVAETDETFLEHASKGGPVMIPIVALAAAAMLVALLKWLQLVFVSTPTRKGIAALLNAVARNNRGDIDDEAEAIAKVRRRPLRDWQFGAVTGALLGGALYWLHDMGLMAFLSVVTDLPYGLWICIVAGALLGAVLEFLLHGVVGSSPVGKMLVRGVEHIDEPTELVEEVMYEEILSTRLKLHRFLPFVAISASSAPLLGLLGTVTGIINTFKLITVFGSGDVKTLSGGISEALVTTEFGLIVAIPSLLLHAFLSRKAKGIVDEMDKAAIALVNQISKTRQPPGDDGSSPDAPPVPPRNTADKAETAKTRDNAEGTAGLGPIEGHQSPA